MKLQIRKGIFETNSSSIHCITVGKTCNASKEVIENAIFEQGEFGWEFDQYTDNYSLASYAFECIASFADDYKTAYKMAEAVIRNLYLENGYDDSNLKFFVNDDGYGGYIDHRDQTYELYKILTTGDGLFRFVFGAGSSVSTGNDNDERKVEPAVSGDNVAEEIYKGN